MELELRNWSWWNWSSIPNPLIFVLPNSGIGIGASNSKAPIPWYQTQPKRVLLQSKEDGIWTTNLVSSPPNSHASNLNYG